jgi:hypothetical protein
MRLRESIKPTIKLSFLVQASESFKDGTSEMHLDQLVDCREEGHMYKQRLDTMLLCKPERVVVHIVAYETPSIVRKHHVVACLPE